ncbi:MAG TPA: folate-binding protein, partial [Acidimicrobiia bacterium]|nr:folate-binding protein [Acidimicrobiia bacterium]
MNAWLAPEAADLVWFRGTDALRFLDDLLSQDLAGMAPGEVGRSLLLSPRGKLNHMLWVLRGEEELGLVTDPGRGEDLATTLGRYRIRVDVDVEPSSEPAWVVMESDEGPDPGSWFRRGSGLESDISWPGVRRTLVIGPRPGVGEGSMDQYEALRIAAGEPRWGVDVDEGTIPQEAGLEEVAVDFTKGCYLGQELVARIDSRGHVNRLLRILEFPGGVPAAGSPIVAVNREVGTLTSVAGHLGLAMVRREVGEGDEVTV